MGNNVTDALIANASLTLGVLSFNEEESLAATHHEVLKALNGFPYDVEIFLLDDGSTDGTPRVSEELFDLHATTRSLSHRTNQGVGACVRTILGESKCSHVMFVPGDNSYDADSIRAVATKMTQADVVVGMRGGGGVTWRRRILRLGVQLSIRIWTYPASFDAGGLNVYRSELLRTCASLEDGYLMMKETCMRISILQPSMIVVPITQKDGSGARSNSVKIAEITSLLRIHRRMLWAKLRSRKQPALTPNG